ALSRLFPVLKQVELLAGLPQREIAIPDSQEIRRRAFNALRELLTNLISVKPIVLFIDDLQWGDLDSAALLAEILRPPDPPPLMLIAAYQSDEADSSPILQSLLPLHGNQSLAVQSLEVGELTPKQAQELALTLLGDKPNADELASLISQESGG